MKTSEYAFIRRVFIAGILLTVVIPCIGLVIVRKRLSMIGDALSYTSLAGMAAGLILGLNPVLTAAAVCVVAVIGIEATRRKIPRFSEMSIAVIMFAGIGLAGVLSGFVKNVASFNSFLSGSIMAISNGELYLIIAVSMVVLLMFLLMYRELFYVSSDEQSARLAGVPVKTVNFLFTVLIVMTVSVVTRTVGAPIVSSMMVVPVTCAMQLGTSHRQTLTFAVAFNIPFTITGLFAAYYSELKPSGTIVPVGVIFLILVFAGKRILRWK